MNSKDLYIQYSLKCHQSQVTNSASANNEIRTIAIDKYQDTTINELPPSFSDESQPWNPHIDNTAIQT